MTVMERSNQRWLKKKVDVLITDVSKELNIVFSKPTIERIKKLCYHKLSDIDVCRFKLVIYEANERLDGEDRFTIGAEVKSFIEGYAHCLRDIKTTQPMR